MLNGDAARAIWKAIIDAAKAAGYTPLRGSPDDATVINASYFELDGARLGFTLTADNATAPPLPEGRNV